MLWICYQSLWLASFILIVISVYLKYEGKFIQPYERVQSKVNKGSFGYRRFVSMLKCSTHVLRTGLGLSKGV